MALSTDDQIEFAVHDDAAALKRLITLPVSARLDALAAMRGVSSFDGAGMEMLRQIHEHGDGFRVAVDDPRYPVAIDRLVKADAWGQIKRDLARAWEYQNVALPGIHHPDRIEVTLTLGNPDDPVFLERTYGYYVLGDEVARRVGSEPVGIPHMGGYAVGRKIVERYLDATGMKAAQAMTRPVNEIFEGAGITKGPA